MTQDCGEGSCVTFNQYPSIYSSPSLCTALLCGECIEANRSWECSAPQDTAFSPPTQVRAQVCFCEGHSEPTTFKTARSFLTGQQLPRAPTCSRAWSGCLASYFSL